VKARIAIACALGALMFAVMAWGLSVSGEYGKPEGWTDSQWVRARADTMDTRPLYAKIAELTKRVEALERTATR